MEIEIPRELLNELEDYVLALGFAMARFIGFIAITPLFTRMGIDMLLRGGIALGLAIPLVPFVFATMEQGHFPGGMMVGMLVMKEVLVGIILGIIFGIPIWAAETAGEFLDLQRGASSAQLFDPLFMSELNITGTFLSVIMVALFFTSGAFMMMLGGVYDSYALWPIDKLWPLLDGSTSTIALGFLDKIASMAIVLAGPIMIALLVADISLAFVSRAAPSLQMFDLSLSVKNALFVILMVVYCVFMIKYMNNNAAFLLDIPAILEDMTINKS
jgi:type III secretion protein T